MTKAHPRSRGENYNQQIIIYRELGSSPLTRGKRRQMHLVHVIRGLIPAHAGKTRPPWPGGHGSPAHPRSRGENTWLLPRGQRARGSSPLTRGNPPTFGRSRVGAGSSPLTRGKRTHLLQLCFITRLIPAHAGKTDVEGSVAVLGWAHPRSRGENGYGPMTGMTHPGSSPLTRGKPGAVWLACAAYGLIPAHAGKTTQHAPPGSRPRAHPRSRGENYRREPLSLADAGSSPLTRGKRSGSPD